MGGNSRMKIKNPYLDWWGLYYLGWIIAFLVPELYWVFTKADNTLSDQTWAFEKLAFSHPFDVGIWTPQHWVMAIIVWGLFGWLSIHIPFGLAR